MATVPFLAGLKAATPALIGGYRLLRRELDRRASGDPFSADDLLNKDIDEALSVLAQKSESLAGQVLTEIKGLLSRPSVFTHPIATAWISTAEAQANLRAAALTLLRGEDDTPYAQECARHYATFSNDPGAESAPEAEILYSEALAFVQRSLARWLSVDTRLLATQLTGVQNKLDAIAAAVPPPADILDYHLAEALLELRQRRFFRTADNTERTVGLANAVLEGPLQGASPMARAQALAWCARLLVYTDPDLARAYCTAVRRLVAEPGPELDVAEAFLASAHEGERATRRLRIDDFPFEATVAFQILRTTLGSAGALEQACRIELGFDKLDGDGRFTFLSALVETKRWADAIAAIRMIREEDFDQTPALLWIAATTLVAARLPDDLKPSVLQDIPPNPAHFKLPEDRASLDERRLARQLLDDVAKRCEKLGLSRETLVARRYALWLALQDPSGREAASENLRIGMATESSSIAFLPLALGYGLEVNRDAALARVERDIARGATADQLVVAALVALVFDFAPNDPLHAASIVTRHRLVLADYIDPANLIVLEAQLLIDADRISDARALLARADPKLLPDDLVSWLAADADADPRPLHPPLAELEAAHARKPDTRTLMRLLMAHRLHGYSPRYFELACELLQLVPNADEAEDIVTFLHQHGRDHEVAVVLDLLGEDIVETSVVLLTHAAWSLYRRGEVKRAEAALTELEDRREHDTDRRLRFQLLVTTGRWTELAGFVDDIWRSKERIEPSELAAWAQLAARIRSPRTRDMVEAAAARAPDNPEVLVGAYSAATTAGLDDEIEATGEWIIRAAELSGESGPIRTVDIAEIVKDAPDWNAQVEHVMRLYAAGAIPTLLAARGSRRSWLHLHLVPLLSNAGAKDPRQRSLVPLYSGQRRSREAAGLSPGGTIAIDRTALITLAALDILEPTLERFDRIIVPHDVLADLFEQRSKVEFHQPSRIEAAKRLIDMIDRGTLAPFEPTTVADRALEDEIGESLAALLSQAISEGRGQHIVIHPFPVHRVGSLLADVAPLDTHNRHLASCQAVLDAVERAGKIRSLAARRARSYLLTREQRWPEEPDIAPGATLYLSDLAVSHLRYAGLLDTIGQAGFKAIISPTEMEEVRSLRDYDEVSGEVRAALDASVGTIARGIAEGRIVLDSIPDATASRAESDDQPTIRAIAQLAERADTIVFDDRFLNRHEQFEHDGGATRIFTSHDILTMLEDLGDLDLERAADLRARLRSGGAIFVPLLTSEIEHLLGAATIDDDRLVETFELRALRESFRLAQLRGWFDRANETPWLIQAQTVLIDAVISQWSPDIDDHVARARSEWLMALAHSRDWSDSIVSPGAIPLAEAGPTLDIARLCTASMCLTDDPADRFAAWLEERLEILWFEEPRFRDALLDYLRKSVLQLSTATGTNPQTHNALATLTGFPRFLQIAMAEDAEFCTRLEIHTVPAVEVGKGATFRRADLFCAVDSAYAQLGKHVPLTDVYGHHWQLTADTDGDAGRLTLQQGKDQRCIRGIIGRFLEADSRTRALDSLARTDQIPSAAIATWRERLAASTLDDDLVTALDEDLAAFPGAVLRILADGAHGPLGLQQLVPASLAYYVRLTGAAGTGCLKDYVSKSVPALAHELAEFAPVDRTMQLLLLASQPTILSTIDLTEFAQSDWRNLCDRALTAGDPLALIGIFELVLPRFCDDPAWAETIHTLLKRIETLDSGDEKGVLTLFCAAAVLVEGEISRLGLLKDWQPFRRRIATLAQAAIVTRALAGKVDAEAFADFCFAQRGWRFFLQNLYDLRLEPRWRPDYLLAEQFRNELLGRVGNAVGLTDPARLCSPLVAILGSEALTQLLPVPMAFWAGPIEGTADSVRGMPPTDLLSRLQDGLEQVDLSEATLTLFVNLEAINSLPEALYERLEERLLSSWAGTLASITPDHVGRVLLGLAYIAAAQRRVRLAEAVWQMMREHKRVSCGNPRSDIEFALVLAAANEDLDAWRECIGSYVREIASRTTNTEAAEQLVQAIETLCAIDPALRSVMARAQAGLHLLLSR